MKNLQGGFKNLADYFIIRFFCNIAEILDLRKSEVFETREETIAGRMQKR